MTGSIDERIRNSRKLLGNPYAFWDGDRAFEAERSPSPLDVHAARRNLKNPWAYVDERGGFSHWAPFSRDRSDQPHQIDPRDLLGHKRQGDRFTKKEIERITRKLLAELWQRRGSIWFGGEPTPLEVIDPVVALEVLGFSVDDEHDIGQYEEGGAIFEVAGIIDRETSKVRVSGRYAPHIRNFTTAHELAHAVLHDRSGLHRDRAHDGSRGTNPAEDRVETEANTFAAYFLMPAKQVRAAFRLRFLTLEFRLTEDTAFALEAQSLADVASKYRTIRDLSSILARAEYYNGERFYSLAKQFNVSIGAMAIRLEELGLVHG